jgi:hypothetical protein
MQTPLPAAYKHEAIRRGDHEASGECEIARGCYNVSQSTMSRLAAWAEEKMSTLIDDLANNEPLMAALGRIALRSAELGEAVDDVTRQLDSVAGKKSRSLMLRKKLALLEETSKDALSSDPHFASICSAFAKILSRS